MRLRLMIFAGLLLAATSLTWADHPLPPVNLSQTNSDTFDLPAGGNTSGSSHPTTVILRASSDAGTCEDPCEYTLGFEIVPTDQDFNNVPTHYVSMPGKDCVETPYPPLTLSGLQNFTAYKWQCIEYTCSCPPPFVPKATGESCFILDGGQGGPTWVQYNGGGTAFVTGGPFIPKFSMAYIPATDNGQGQVFFYDKNALPTAQSWKIEVRRTDFTNVFLNTFIVNHPGGPPPGDVTGFNVFDLPRVDIGTPTSFEVDLMYRVLVFSGLDATGVELYRSAFYYSQHPSATPWSPFTGFPAPTAAGLQSVPYVEARPVGQNLMANYELYQKLLSGPQALLRTNGHGIMGAYPTKYVHPPTILSNPATVFSGDSIFYVRPKRRYRMNTGFIIGNFDIAPKSANSAYNIP